jgi:hypothetical protein
MSKNLPWLRLYTEIIDDEKLGLLAFEDRWHFIAILCLKGKGVLDSEPDAEMLHRKAALKMGIAVAELEKVLMRLSRMGLVDKDTLQPRAWDARQMQSDSSADRVRAFRERTKQAKRPGNVSVTAQELDTDKDLEKEREEDKGKRARAPASLFVLPDWIPNDAWDAFMETRKAKKAKSTDYALGLIVKALKGFAADGHDPVNILENSIKSGWTDVYAPKPAAAPKSRQVPALDNFAGRVYVGGKL